MFYLRNLISGEEITLDSKRAVLSYWRWWIQAKNKPPVPINQFNFDELNVTGKDMYYGIVGRNPFFPGLYTYNYGWKLKEYQVLDEYRRSCDIREWKQEMEEVLAETFPSWDSRPKAHSTPRFRIDPAGHGIRYPHANSQSPAFTKQRLEIYHNGFELDLEDDLLGFTPMTDHSKPRKIDWSYKRNRASDSRSWKRTTKNRSQWGRHMNRVPELSVKREIAREMVEEELELANLSDDELNLFYGDFPELDNMDEDYEDFWDDEELWCC